MIELYVSPHGNDVWRGAAADPAPDGNDGPLCTLAAAQRAVRRIKATLASPEEIRVNLRGGTYALDETWRFHAEDAGFGREINRKAKTWPVTWAAYGDETPIVSGGRRIEGPWQQETLNGKTVYTATPPAELLERGFTQLWVNGERRHRPRLPKEGVWQVERGFHKDTDFKGPGHTQSSDACVYREGQLSADWHKLHDVELHFFGWWIDRWVKVREIEEASRTVRFDRTAKLRMEWSPGQGVDYVVENVFEALTEPGEWYLDRHAGKLYYLPMPGEDIEQVEVVAGVLPKLLEIDGGGRWSGEGEGNEDLKGGGGGHLRFEGLRFEHCEWHLPDDQAGDKQAAVHVPASITVRGAEGVVFEDCRIERVNTYAAEVLDSSVETTFSRCTMRDLGAGGVVIWHGCRRNAVLDCEIGPGGLVHAAGCGVLIGKATGNRVIHNHIHDFYYSGVSAGWNWGYAESHGYGNVIEGNHIHDLGKELLSDMGGIYLLGHACGTRLRYNHIHDITCRRYGGWAMYTDEGSTDVLIESNLCYRTNRNPFHTHYGRNNTVRNNILAYGGHCLIAYGKPEPHLGITFERNILLSGGEPILQKWVPERWTPEQTRFESNFYWCEDGEVRFTGGGVAVYGTQTFPDGFLAEVDRLAPLDPLPTAEATAPHEPPNDGEWDRAHRLEQWTSATGVSQPEPSDVDVRMLRKGDDLWVRGRFARPEKFETATGAVWNREHVELFLKPSPDRPMVLQLGLAPDGESAVIWHGEEAPTDFDWHAEAKDDKRRWEALLRIPLNRIARAAGIDGSQYAWGFLMGFASPSPIGDFEAWQRAGHDPTGRVTDPRFFDPRGGDFRLSEDSPAQEKGFIAWDYTRAGPRPR